MSSEEIIAIISDFTPFGLVKFFSLLLILMHLAFSYVLIRQTRLMVKIVEAQISPLIYTLSLIHFFASLATLGFAVLFL